MTLNRPKGPDPNDDPSKGGDFDAHFFAGVLAELEQFEHGADLWALISAIEGIIGRSGPEILNAEQRARLIAAIDRAEAAAFKHLELFEPELVDSGFAALRFAADAWARPPLSRQARELAGLAETRRQADAAAHSKILLNEVSTEALRRRVSERAAAAAPQPGATLSPTESRLDNVLRRATWYLEKAAGEVDPITNAAKALRMIIRADDEVREDGVLVLNPADVATLARMSVAVGRAPAVLAKVLSASIPDVDVALGIAGALVLAARLGGPNGVWAKIPPERAACMAAHCRALSANLDVVLARRAIIAAGDIVRRDICAASLMQAEPSSLMVH